MGYWRWFFRGTGAGAGLARFADRWLVVHVAIGVSLAWINSIVLKDAANSVLLPLAGVFVGLCFAWGGNAQALLQTEELEQVGERHPGGFIEYLFVYQTAILVVLVTLVLWGFAGLALFDNLWPIDSRGLAYRVVRGVLFFFASLTVRECWHVVLGAQSMLYVRHELRRARAPQPKGEE
jgi:hypothetical protein